MRISVKPMYQFFSVIVLCLVQANLSVACHWWLHQPQVPESLRETDI